MSEYPFIQGQKRQANGAGSLPLFKEYAWDFEKDSFIYEKGRHKIITGREALKVWIYKTLKTERYRYLAYTTGYGAELEQFIGRRANDDEAAAEVRRYVTEALLVNPYITELSNVTYTNENDVLNMEITVDSIYGEVVAIV